MYELLKNIFENKKTWAGLIVSLLGTLGVAEIIGGIGYTTELINAILTLGGLIFAGVGNYIAHKKLKELQ